VVVSSQPTGCRCSHQTNRRATTHDASSRWPLPRTVRWACWHGLPTAISSLSRSARLGQRRLAPSPSIWQATLRCGTTATDAYGPSPWPQITELVNTPGWTSVTLQCAKRAHLSQMNQHWLSSTSSSPPSSNTHRGFHRVIGLCSMKN
jgi:hypothetical protein